MGHTVLPNQSISHLFPAAQTWQDRQPPHPLYSMWYPLDTFSLAGKPPLSFFHPYCLLILSHMPPPHKDRSFSCLHGTRSPSMIETHPQHTGIIGPPTIHIRVYVGQQGHLQQYLLKQVVVDRCAGHVPVGRNQPDSERNCYLEWRLHVDPATLKEFAHMFCFFFFFIW